MAHHPTAWVQALSQRSWFWLIAAIYFGVIALEFMLTGMVMRWIDQHYPNVYFYHLNEGEIPGPLGDLDAAWLAIRISYGLFSLIFLPLAVLLKVPFRGIVGLLLLKEPAELLMIFGLLLLRRLMGI